MGLAEKNKYDINRWSNSLINISQSLILGYKFLEYTTFNMQEFKLLLYLISKIDEKHKEFYNIELSLKEMEFALGIKISGGTTLKFIREKLENIRAKGIYVKERDNSFGFFSCNIIRSYAYDSKTKRFNVKLDDDMKPFLLGIKDEARAMFREGYVTRFKSLSAIKLFLYFHSIADMKDYIINSKKLTIIMEYEGEYKNFHTRSLIPALDYINNNTDITVTFTPIKNNKKTVGYITNVRQKPAWMIKECGLTAYIDLDCLPSKDIKEYIPSSPILNPIKLTELSPHYRSILWGLERQYD